MARLFLLLNPILDFLKKENGESIIEYLKNKFPNTTLKDVALYVILFIFVIYLITKLSGIIFWMVVVAAVVIFSTKLVRKYFSNE